MRALRRRREVTSALPPTPSTKKRVLLALFLLALAAVLSTVYLLLSTGRIVILSRGNTVELRGLRQQLPVVDLSLQPVQLPVIASSPVPPVGVPEPLPPPAVASEVMDAVTEPPAPVASAPPALPARAAEKVKPMPAPLLPPLLVVGIPTLRREGDPTYIVRTLGFLLNQTTGAFPGLTGSLESGGSDVKGSFPLRLRVLVMDNTRAPGTHAAFEEAADLFLRSLPGAGPVSTHRVTDSRDPTGGSVYVVESGAGGVVTFAYNGRSRVEDGLDPGNDNVPGFKVRAQTRDVVDLMFLAEALFGSRGDWGVGGGEGEGTPLAPPHPGVLGSDMAAYMFLEDDFRVCPQGLASLAFAFSRAEAESQGGGWVGQVGGGALPWNALRVSYGLNGGVLRGGDVRTLARYLSAHLARRPPDHLWVEWFAGETPESGGHKGGRPHFAFRYNILEHFGYSSSLRDKVSPLYALCYQTLDSTVVFEVEAFKMEACSHDHVWPCWAVQDPRYATLAGPGIDFQGLWEKSASGDTVQSWGRG